MPAYHPQRIEPKWQAYWEQNQTFRATDLDRNRPKLYILDMFPYPSGAGLHVGHPEGYTATDILCRYKRMRGFNVLHPMGWDAFGLPAEQYAIQTGTHPRITTQANIDTFRRQIKSLGFTLRLGPRGRYHRPGLLQVDAVDLPQALRHLVRPRVRLDRSAGQRAQGQGPADRRAADPRGHRRPGRPIATASGWPTAPRSRSTGARRWARCWPTRKSSTARASAAASPSSGCRCGSGCCASPPTPSACSTTWSWSTGRDPSRRCSATGSAGAKGRRSISRILLDDDLASWEVRRQSEGLRRDSLRRRDPRLHDPARHALRRHLHGAGARASAGRPDHDARAAATRSRAYREQAAAQERPRPHRAGQEEDRRLHRRLRRSIRSTASRSRSGSPTTC